MNQVFIFNKTYETRLEEYKNVLGGHEVLPVSQIKKEWSDYLQLAIQPKGWKAIWKIPRIRCEELSIEFPTVVLVYVEDVDFSEMSASVEVVGVQSHIPLSNKNKVGLVHLWVTKEQDESFQSNIELMAYNLDTLQFFYMYLLMPWDHEDDDATDWFNTHLETRLHLFYDMRNGIIPRLANERLKWLLNQAKRLQYRREKIDSESSDASNGSNREDLLKIHVYLLKVRAEYDLLGNPLLRNSYLKRYNYNNSSPRNWLVFSEGKIQDYIELVGTVKDVIGNDRLTSVSSFSATLEVADSGDKIILNKEVHCIMDTASLPLNIVLMGLCARNDTVISNMKDGIMFDCFGNVTLENLTIDVKDGQCGIVIRSGSTRIKNCKVLGNDKTSSHRGIIVQPGACLSMIDCEINGFYVGLFGMSQANITIRNCEISNSVIGYQSFDCCSITIEDLVFNNCEQFGVYADTENILEAGSYQKGNFSLLERIPGVTVKNVIGKNIGKSETVILHRSENLFIEDLFDIPDLNNAIIYEDSIEKMDMNNTIKEDNVNSQTEYSTLV